MTPDEETKEHERIDASSVGVVFQYPEHQLFEETVEKDIAFGPRNFGVGEAKLKRVLNEILPAVGSS